MPLEEDPVGVSLPELTTALYRYIYRNLQGGIQQPDRVFMQFLPYREDFWPVGYEDYKCEVLMMDPTISTMTLAHIGHFFYLAEETLRNRRQ